MAKKAVVGIFDSPYQAESCLNRLNSAGFLPADISVLTPDKEGVRDFIHKKATKAPEGVATGATTGGVIGVNAGPLTPGTAYVKYHHLIGSLDGYQGAWGFVTGGMGMVAGSIAAFGKEHGVEIATDAEVAEIEIQDGRARGVRLLDGRRYEADVVLSNADPHRTYLGMVGEKHLPSELVEGVKRLKVKGSVVKVLLGLGELPNFTAYPGTEIGPQHTGGITRGTLPHGTEEALVDDRLRGGNLCLVSGRRFRSKAEQIASE